MVRKNNNAIQRAAFSQVEQLEQRRMLSSSVTSHLTPDTDPDFNILVVTGTKNKDYITVFDDPEGNTATVWNDKNHNGNEDNGEDTEYDEADLDGVLIDSQQGDDCVKYELVTTYDDNQRSIEADLSDGNDKFTFESLSETMVNNAKVKNNGVIDEAAIVDHSNINLEVDGQEKNDTIDVDLGGIDISESSVFVNVDAGSGNDKVSLELGPEIGGDDVSAAPAQTLGGGGASDYTQIQAQIDLGSGNNLYSQEIGAEIDFAEITINVNGGTGKDTVQDEEDYLMGDDSGLFVTVNLEGGNDYYNGDFGFIAVEEGSEASYNLQGGDGNDRMTFEDDQQEIRQEATVFPDEPPSLPFVVDGIFQVNMYGGTGNDTMDMWADNNEIQSTAKPAAKPSVSNSNDQMAPLYIDTGEVGDVRVVMSGDAGNDKVELNLGASSDSDGDYDLSVLGAAGKDTVAAGFDDETLFDSQNDPPTSFVTFGPSGAILLDGGRDSDTYEAIAEFEIPVGFLTPFSIRSVETFSNSLLPPLI